MFKKELEYEEVMVVIALICYSFIWDFGFFLFFLLVLSCLVLGLDLPNRWVVCTWNEDAFDEFGDPCACSPWRPSMKVCRHPTSIILTAKTRPKKKISSSGLHNNKNIWTIDLVKCIYIVYIWILEFVFGRGEQLL